jgi:hypothetical protein
MLIKVDKFDAAFSILIRARDSWTCQRCSREFIPRQSGKKWTCAGLHCSHLIGRGCHTTRWHPLAACAKCHGCHSYLTSHPLEFAEWIRNYLGEERYEFLRILKRPENARKWRKREKEQLWLEMQQELRKLDLYESGHLEFFSLSLPEAERVGVEHGTTN